MFLLLEHFSIKYGIHSIYIDIVHNGHYSIIILYYTIIYTLDALPSNFVL
jgi:hypothetical protein